MTDSIWSKLAATLPPEGVEWRQDGKVTQRDGRFIARFVAYTNAQFVRERLDAVAPGEWNLTLAALPPRVSGDGVEDEACAFKATLTVAGATREDVGVGKDYKQASTDAFKRAAVRFGIGHELYTEYETIWVEMDGDGKFAKPTQDPASVWAKKAGRPSPKVEGEQRPDPTASAPSPSRPTAPSASAPTSSRAESQPSSDEPACPICGGKMWDDRANKKNPKAPDFRCRNKPKVKGGPGCEGVIWPAKPNAASAGAKPGRETDGDPVRVGEEMAPGGDWTDPLPF